MNRWRTDERAEWKFSFVVPNEDDLTLHPNEEFTIVPNRFYLTYVRSGVDSNGVWLMDYWKAAVHSPNGIMVQYFDLLSFNLVMQWFQLCQENTRWK